MKAIFQVIVWKIKSLFNSRCSFSATVYGSTISDKAAIRQNTRFYESSIGKYSYIGRNSLVQFADIGSYCSISEGVNIGMPSHPIDFVSTSPVFLEGKNFLGKNFSSFEYEDCPRTVIGSDVWIGAGVQIKSGLTVGDGAVIGAGAVVTHDVPPYAVAAGVPAKIIRYRFSEEKISRLMQLKWWDLEDGELQKYAEKFNNVDSIIND